MAGRWDGGGGRGEERRAKVKKKGWHDMGDRGRGVGRSEIE